MLNRHAADAPIPRGDHLSTLDVAPRGHGRRAASAAAALCVAAVLGVTALVAQHDRPSGQPAGGRAASAASAALVTPATLPFVLPPGRTLNSLPARVVPSTGLDQPRLDAIAARLDQAGNSRFPSSYSSVALDEEHDRVLCYRTPSSAFDQYVLTAFRGQPVVLIDALFSKGQLNRTANRILTDLSYWRTKGVHVNSFGASPTGSGVDVTITEPITPAVTTAFRTRYAPVAIQLTTGLPDEPAGGGGGTGGVGGGAARYSPGPSPSR